MPEGSFQTWAVLKPGQFSNLGGCHTGAVVTLGQLSTWAVVLPGQLSNLGSCLTWAVVYLGSCLPGQCLPGQLSAWAVVAWAVVGASNWNVQCPPPPLLGKYLRILCGVPTPVWPPPNFLVSAIVSLAQLVSPSVALTAELVLPFLLTVSWISW